MSEAESNGRYWDDSEVDRIFRVEFLSGGQPDVRDEIVRRSREFARFLIRVAGECPERDRALERVEEAMYWSSVAMYRTNFFGAMSGQPLRGSAKDHFEFTLAKHPSIRRREEMDDADREIAYRIVDRFAMNPKLLDDLLERLSGGDPEDLDDTKETMDGGQADD